jgi:glycosyl transferase family 87
VRSSLVLALAATAAFAVKLTLALNTHGTNDMVFYELCLAKDRADGGLALFRDGIPRHGTYANTAFMIHAYHGWDWLAQQTGLPFRFWFRATGALADAASLVLVLKLVQPGLPILLLVALSPVSIIISGFHGTTDPIHVALTVLTIFVTERYGRPWLSGAVLAVAMSIKVLPLIYIPAFILCFPALRKKIEFLVALAVAFFALSLPYIAQDPVLVLSRVFGYPSQFGFWGVPRLLTLLDSALNSARPLTLIYYALGRPASLVAVAWLCWKYRDSPAPLFTRVSLVAFFFMTWTPGWGIQYLSWLVPFTAVAGLRPALAYHLISGLYLFTVYTYWSGGLPWDLADSLTRGMWKGPAIAVELASWATVVWMWRRIQRRVEEPVPA